MQAVDTTDSALPLMACDPVTDRMCEYYASGSAIRKMFEEGLRLKAIHGNDQVADLSIGNPSFPPPPLFEKSLRTAAKESDYHSYMPNAGYPWVRKNVATYLNQRGYFDGVAPEQIVMTSGAAGALNVVLAAMLRPGDEVIVPRPFFVEYRFYVELHGGRLRPVDSRPDFEIDTVAIEKAVTSKTRAILVNSPNNPTGRVYGRASLQRLADLLSDIEVEAGKRIYLISDEPYRDILFTDEPFTSPASLYPNSFMCYSWSKSFSVPGERIGYLAANPKMPVRNWTSVMGTLAMCNRILGFINAPALMQRAIGASLDAPVDIDHYRQKRNQLCETLAASGYEFAVPEGAFYIFPKSPESEREFVARAKRHLLLGVPGSGFGREGYFRLCFAVPQPTVDLACTKLIQIKREIDES